MGVLINLMLSQKDLDEIKEDEFFSKIASYNLIFNFSLHFGHLPAGVTAKVSV